MDRLKIIFDNSPDVLMLVAVERDGEQFRILEANSAAEAVTGLPRHAFIGATFEGFLPPLEAARLTGHYRRCYLSGQLTEFELSLTTPSGDRSWQIRLKPYREQGSGGISHLVVSARDITWTRDVGQLLTSLEGQLPGFVYQIGHFPDGSWRYTFASGNAEVIFGLNREQILTDSAGFLARIHPDDRPRVLDDSEAAVAALKPWHGEFRMLDRDGRYIWLSAHDIPQKLADGTVLCTGYANDITDKKSLEESLRRSEAKFRQLVENASDIIATVERDGTLSYVSPNWTAALGHPLAAVEGSDVCCYVAEEDQEPCRRLLADLFASGQARGGIETRLRHQNGEWFWFLANVSPLYDSGGGLMNFMVIARDITRNKGLEQAMRRLAEVDPVTELANRSAFLSRLELAIQASGQSGQSFALLYLDLDGFKKVNDSHGHQVGDDLLRTVGAAIPHLLRSRDQVGRIGGDEFMVILDGPITLADARAVAEKICHHLVAPAVVDGLALSLAVSIGVALFPQHGGDMEKLIRAADMAMYAAKARGGHQVCVAAARALPGE